MFATVESADVGGADWRVRKRERGGHLDAAIPPLVKGKTTRDGARVG